MFPFLQRIRKHPFFIKLFHWEYWSFNVVYAPLYPYWFWLCLRARAFFYFNASNPTIRNGGFLMESKKEIYDLLPDGTYPTTLLFQPGTNVAEVLAKVQHAGIEYPMIGKPDIGMRGLSVKKLENDAELAAYTKESKVDFLIQAYIPFESEVGIFYYRIPGEVSGHITGIVGKEFLTVTGDGYSTTEQLLYKDQRFILQLPILLATLPAIKTEVLAAGEKKVLVPYGNHARGAKFLDFSALITNELTQTIDQLAQSIKGYYYGRMDIRYHSWELLEKGEYFSIIELNGAGSEPTHMYDPKHSIFYAWKEIIRHWKLMYRISVINHQNGVAYMSRKEGLAMLKANAALVKQIS